MGYAQSKTANNLFSIELHERLKGAGIVSCAVLCILVVSKSSLWRLRIGGIRFVADVSEMETAILTGLTRKSDNEG